MRLHRFYVEQPLGEEVVIDDVSLIKQWTKVFRYAAGDSVVLFNGDGRDITYVLKNTGNKQCLLSFSSSTASYIPTKKITLFLSLIKKDNFELVVQKATELGVTTIVPLISERSEKKNLNEERLCRIAMEASEQCGRGDQPHISTIKTLNEAFHTLTENTSRLVLQMNGEQITTVIQKHTNDNPICFFIGPEGGWSTEEEELFKKHNFKLVSLGNTVLRAETAAIAACAAALCC